MHQLSRGVLLSLCTLASLVFSACDDDEPGGKPAAAPTPRCKLGASCEGCRCDAYCNADNVCREKAEDGEACTQAEDCQSGRCFEEVCRARTKEGEPCDSCSDCKLCLGTGPVGTCSAECTVSFDEWGLTRTGDSCREGQTCYQKRCWPLCSAQTPCEVPGVTCDYGAVDRNVSPGVGACVPKVRESIPASDECPWTRDGALSGTSKDGGTAADAGADAGGARRYTMIALGNKRTCALRDDHKVVCGGTPLPDALMTAPLRYLDIGEYFACGVRADSGALLCVAVGPANGASVASPPSGSFRMVSVESRYACALDSGGAIRCWGGSSPSPPSGSFSELATNSDGLCAIRASDGRLQCAGLSEPWPTGAFLSVDGSNQLWCAVLVAGGVRCWGHGSSSLVPYTEADAGTPKLKRIWVQGNDVVACGISEAGTITCLGPQRNAPPSGTFTQLATNWLYECGLTTTGQVQCWSPFGTTNMYEPPAPDSGG